MIFESSYTDSKNLNSFTIVAQSNTITEALLNDSKKNEIHHISPYNNSYIYLVGCLI